MPTLLCRAVAEQRPFACTRDVHHDGIMILADAFANAEFLYIVLVMLVPCVIHYRKRDKRTQPTEAGGVVAA